MGLDLVAEASAAPLARVRIFANPTTRQGPNDQMYYLVIGPLKASSGLNPGRNYRVGHVNGRCPTMV